MNISKVPTTRTTIVLLTVMSFLISLTPHVPGKPVVTAKKQPDRAALPSSDAAAKRAREAYGNLPLSFEPNRGQADKQVRFLSRGSGYALFLTATDALLALNNSSETAQGLRMKLVGGNPAAKLAGEHQLEGQSNYLTGNDRRKWTLDIPTYGSVRAKDVYPGVDVVYYGSDQRRLEYDFVIGPGADPRQVRLSFEGAEKLSLDADGGIRLKLKDTEVVQPAPVVYQETDGERQQVAGHYALAGGNEVVFDIGAYDRDRTLVIDPQLVYASFHGGSGNDSAQGIAVDDAGNAYVVGSTLSANLPVTTPFQSTLQGSNDIFVVKINPGGTSKVYSTYLGGSFQDLGKGIAVTGDGKACITGTTQTFGNGDYPITANRYQGNGSVLFPRDVDGVVSMLTPAGNGLVYSTYIGGNDADHPNGIAVDAANNIYITGDTFSRDFPTKNAFQRNPGARGQSRDAFVARFDPSKSGNSSLIYSTFLGGDGREFGNAIAVTAAGVAFVVGETEATDFPTASPSSLPPLRASLSGAIDGFVAKFSPAGALIYSTYFGGNGDDHPTAVAVDANERAYVAGFTLSTAATFPLKNAFDSTRSGANGDAFVAKLNADGTALFYSSFITGGDDNTQPGGIALDIDGSAFVTGSAVSQQTPFPVVNGFPSSVPKGFLFLVKVGPSDATGTTVPAILLSDTLAANGSTGIALDQVGNVYLAGTVNASGFPIATPGAFQQVGGGATDAYALKINFSPPDTIGLYRPSTSQFLERNTNTAGPPDATFAFGQAGDLPIAGDWGGDGITDVGVFRNGQFLLRQPLTLNLPGHPATIFIGTIAVNFGQAGDLPVVGDWDGDGKDTPGVYRPGTNTFLLTNSNANNSAPPVNISFPFGAPGDLPVAGDWNADGITTVGLYRPSTNTFFLANTFAPVVDITFGLGAPGDLPVAGDWDSDGKDTLGLYRSSTSTFFLDNSFTTNVDVTFNFGQFLDQPVAGVWNKPPNSGVNDPSQGSSQAGQVQQFTTTCSDIDGWHNIATIDFKIAKSDGNGNGVPIALWVQFDENNNLIHFYDPDMQTWSSGTPGSNTILSSRFADLYLAQTNVHGSGPHGRSVKVTWSIVFKDAAVMNNYKQFLLITDDSGFNTGFDRVGSWSVIKP